MTAVANLGSATSSLIDLTELQRTNRGQLPTKSDSLFRIVLIQLDLSPEDPHKPEVLISSTKDRYFSAIRRCRNLLNEAMPVLAEYMGHEKAIAWSGVASSALQQLARLNPFWLSDPNFAEVVKHRPDQNLLFAFGDLGDELLRLSQAGPLRKRPGRPRAVGKGKIADRVRELRKARMVWKKVYATINVEFGKNYTYSRGGALQKMVQN
jgi:hypothetical protein